MRADVTLFFLLHPPVGSQFPPCRYGTQDHFLAHLERETFYPLAGEIRALMTAFNAFSCGTGPDGTRKAETEGSI